MAWTILQRLPADHGAAPADRVAEAARRMRHGLEHIARGSRFWRQRSALTVADVLRGLDEFAGPPRAAAGAPSMATVTELASRRIV